MALEELPWDLLRWRALDSAIDSFFLPLAERFAKKLLRESATRVVIEGASQELLRRLLVGPMEYPVLEPDEDNDAFRVFESEQDSMMVTNWFEAARRGDTRLISKMVNDPNPGEQPLDVSVLDPDGLRDGKYQTAVGVAAENGHGESEVGHILEDVQQHQWFLAAETSPMAGGLAKLRNFIKAGQDLHVEDDTKNWKAVRWAAAKSNSEVVEYLVRHDRENLHKVTESTQLQLVGVFLTTEKEDPGFAVGVDGSGMVVDYVTLPPVNRRDELEARLVRFIERVFKMDEHESFGFGYPHAVLIGGSVGMRARGVLFSLREKMREWLCAWANPERDEETYVEDSEDLKKKAPYFYVCIVDDAVSRIYAASRPGKRDFPDYHVNLRTAVSICRYAQDPLMECAALWTDPSLQGAGRASAGEILALRLHPMQQDVSSMALLAALERAFAHAVALTGVSLNQAIAHPHRSRTLQFVSGLGPRKASALIDLAKKDDGIVVSREDTPSRSRGDYDDDVDDRRSQYLSLQGLLKGQKHVFKNAAGFVKVEYYNDVEIDPLDETRVHPESYVFAWQLAGEACDKDIPVNDGTPNYFKKQSKLVREASVSSSKRLKKTLKKKKWWMRDRLDSIVSCFSGSGPWVTKEEYSALQDNPVVNADGEPAETALHEKEHWELQDGFRDLDLKDFAEQIKSGAMSLAFQTLTLNRIKDELRFPFVDWRKPWRPLPRDELFDLLTGETTASLCEGMLVTAEFIQYQDQSGYLDMRLSNGLRASVSDRMIGISQDEIMNLRRGHLIVGRIARDGGIDRERFKVRLFCSEQDVRETPDWVTDKFRSDRYWRKPRVVTARAQKPKAKPRFIARAIEHPNFLNLDRAGAEKYISEKEVGEAVIRPSSKGIHNLTLTWKCCDVANGGLMFQHVDVMESGKHAGLELTIGSKLRIKVNRETTDEFVNLDDLLATYIQPMSEFVREIFAYDRFHKGSRSDVDAACNSLKATKSIPYFIARNEKQPGHFLLHFQPGRTVRHCTFAVRPDGYHLLGERHISMRRLINWFKKNYASIKTRSANSHPPPASRFASYSGRGTGRGSFH